MSVLTEVPPPQRYSDFSERGAFNAWMRAAMIVAGVLLVIALLLCFIFRPGSSSAPTTADEQQESKTAEQQEAPAPDLFNPVRPAPAAFPPDSNMPRGKESLNVGAIDLKTFNEKRDLVRFEDKRVWFNSDAKMREDKEDDHLIHRSMEVPLKRLVNLVEKKKGKLKIHDAYRHTDKNTIHTTVSLHCEGRAIDLTVENISLSELAKLTWQAGFDFVLYEKPRRSGEHIHASVKRQPDAPAAAKK